MANISNAVGTIYVGSEVFAQSPRDFIDLWEALGEYDYYGISVLSFANQSAEFSGDGKWFLENTLPAFFNTEDIPELEPVAKLLHSKDATLEFEYDEYEPGAGLLSHVELQLGFDENGKAFIAESKYTDYDYTRRNILSLDFEEGYDLSIKSQREEFKKDIFLPFYKENQENIIEEMTFEELWINFLDNISNDEYYEGVMFTEDYEDEDQLVDLMIA